MVQDAWYSSNRFAEYGGSAADVFKQTAENGKIAGKIMPQEEENGIGDRT
ncbi:MAG: hypothetical protein OHK0041_15760 [Anaerolineales bacterium]